MIEQACKHLEVNPETYFKSEETYVQNKEMQETMIAHDLNVQRKF